MWQTAAVANMNFAKARLGGAVEFGGLFLELELVLVSDEGIVNQRGPGGPRYSRLGSRRYFLLDLRPRIFQCQGAVEDELGGR